MPLVDLTSEQLGLLDYLSAPSEPAAPVAPTPQTLFSLPPPAPATRFFTGRRGNSDPYGLAAKASAYQTQVQAEQDAFRIGQLLQGIDPTGSAYPQQRLAALSQAPLAIQDPRGKALISAADFAYQQSRQRRPEQSIMERAAFEGVTPEEVAQFTLPDGTVDTVSLSSLAGQRRLANRPQASVRNPLDSEIINLQRAYDSFEDMGGPEAKAQRESVRKLLQQKLQQRYPELGTAAAPVAAAPTRVTIKSITPL